MGHIKTKWMILSFDFDLIYVLNTTCFQGTVFYCFLMSRTKFRLEVLLRWGFAVLTIHFSADSTYTFYPPLPLFLALCNHGYLAPGILAVFLNRATWCAAPPPTPKRCVKRRATCGTWPCDSPWEMGRKLPAGRPEQRTTRVCIRR